MSGRPTILWHYLALERGYWTPDEMLTDLYLKKKWSTSRIANYLGTSRHSVAKKIKHILGPQIIRPRGGRSHEQSISL